jgi:putative flippase GtrA
VNRRWVFARHGRPPAGWRAAARYAVLAAAVLVLNVVLLDALVTVMGSVLPAKVVTEASLFLASFVVQRQVVFARPAVVEVAPRSPVEQPAAACQAIRRSASS